MSVPFSQTKSRKLVAVNTVSQVIGRLATSAATLVMTFLIAGAFGADGYGDFVKISTYVALFYLLSDFGFNAAFLRDSQNESEVSGSWNILASLRLYWSLILVFVCVALLAFFPVGDGQGYTGSVRFGIILLSPAIIFQGLITSVNGLFQKHLTYVRSLVAVLAGSLSSILIVFLATKATPPYGLWGSSIALLAGSVVTAGIGLWVTVRERGQFHLVADVTKIRRLFFLSIPLGATLLFNLIYFRVDSFILALTRSTVEVGVYGFVYKVFELPLVLPTFFMNAVYPILLVRQGDGSSFLRLVKRSFWVLVAGSAATGAALWFVSPLVSLVRPEFAAGIPALKILAFSMPFFFLSSLTMWLLITAGKQLALAVIYAVSMGGNVLLNVLFIPGNGFMAAAWITVISEAMVLALSALAVVQYGILKGKKPNEI